MIGSNSDANESLFMHVASSQQRSLYHGRLKPARSHYSYGYSLLEHHPIGVKFKDPLIEPTNLQRSKALPASADPRELLVPLPLAVETSAAVAFLIDFCLSFASYGGNWAAILEPFNPPHTICMHRWSFCFITTNDFVSCWVVADELLAVCGLLIDGLSCAEKLRWGWVKTGEFEMMMS